MAIEDVAEETPEKIFKLQVGADGVLSDAELQEVA